MQTPCLQVTVAAVEDYGLLVGLTSSIRALVPPLHMTETAAAAAKAKAKFKVSDCC